MKCLPEIFFTDLVTFDKKRTNTLIDFNTTASNAKGTAACEFYQTINGGSQVRMNPSNTSCDISYTFTTAGTYEILLVATDDETTSSKTIFLYLWDAFSSSINAPVDGKYINVNKTFNLTSTVDNNMSIVLCDLSHKRADLGTFTSFSSSCNTTLSLPSVNSYSIKLDTNDTGDSSTSTNTISVNILDNLSSSITALSRSTWNNNEAIAFNGSYDNNTSAVTCEWISRLSDVNTSRGTNCSSLTHTFETTGSYTVFYKVTDTGTGDVSTSSVSFTVVLLLTGTTSSPLNSSVYNLSQSITFTVGSVNNIGTITYQWQHNRDNTGWTNFGTNSASITAVFATGGTYQFRVLLTDSGRPFPINTGYSNTITGVLVANPLSASVTSPTSGSGHFTNANITFVSSVSNAVNGVSTYTWEYSTNQSTWIIFGGNNSSETFSFSTIGTKYIRVTVVDGASRSATSVSSYNVVISDPVTPDLTDIFLNYSSYYTFSPSTYTYSGVRYLSSTINSKTVIPTGSGTITVNVSPVTSGSESGPINISDGLEKTITVVATVSGAPSKTYTIYVRKVISSGGLITEGVSGGVVWRVHRFISGGTFNSNIALTGQLLVVGGGGGAPYNGAGGNGGQYRYFSSQAISLGNTTVTIGSGGYTDSSWPRKRISGTSSSFGATTSTGGATNEEGFGFSYGGANGIGTAGSSSAAGGAGAPGISNSITGTSVAYAKGGNGNSTYGNAAANIGNGANGFPDMPGSAYGGTWVVIVRIEMPINLHLD